MDGLEKIDPHNWLYSTGRPYRYNPAGTDCVYFSETQEVAQMESDSYWQGMPGEFQPVATYHAEVSLSRVLDLDPLLHPGKPYGWCDEIIHALHRMFGQTFTFLPTAVENSALLTDVV